jgi:hypothetical protein
MYRVDNASGFEMLVSASGTPDRSLVGILCCSGGRSFRARIAKIWGPTDGSSCILPHQNCVLSLDRRPRSLAARLWGRILRPEGGKVWDRWTIRIGTRVQICISLLRHRARRSWAVVVCISGTGSTGLQKRARLLAAVLVDAASMGLRRDQSRFRRLLRSRLFPTPATGPMKVVRNRRILHLEPVRLAP